LFRDATVQPDPHLPTSRRKLLFSSTGRKLEQADSSKASQNLYEMTRRHNPEDNISAHYNHCTWATRECSTGQWYVWQAIKTFRQSSSIVGKNNKVMYRNNKTWLAARVWSLVTVVSVESEGFSSFFK
jgi:hypothetical protein